MSVYVDMVVCFNTSQLNPRFVTELYSDLVQTLVVGNDLQRQQTLLALVEAMKRSFTEYIHASPLTPQQIAQAYLEDIVPKDYCNFQIIVKYGKVHVVPIRHKAIVRMRMHLRLTRDELLRCDIGGDLVLLDQLLNWQAMAGCRPQETACVANMLFDRLEPVLARHGYYERESCALRYFASSCPLKSIEVDSLVVR